MYVAAEQLLVHTMREFRVPAKSEISLGASTG
jgi:hypothetical protein